MVWKFNFNMFQAHSSTHGNQATAQGTSSIFKKLAMNQVNTQHIYMDKTLSVVPTQLTQVLSGFWMLSSNGWNDTGRGADSHICYQLHKDNNSYQNMAF